MWWFGVTAPGSEIGDVGTEKEEERKEHDWRRGVERPPFFVEAIE